MKHVTFAPSNIKDIKQLLVILMLTSLFLQTFNKAIIVFDYHINTISYLKDCENIFKPQLNCNGQCKLMKKIQEAEKNDQQQPERKAESKTDIIFSAEEYAIPLTPVTVLTRIHHISTYEAQPVKMPLPSLFRPPALNA